jgi:hypothetical protein
MRSGSPQAHARSLGSSVEGVACPREGEVHGAGGRWLGLVSKSLLTTSMRNLGAGVMNLYLSKLLRS